MFVRALTKVACLVATVLLLSGCASGVSGTAQNAANDFCDGLSGSQYELCENAAPACQGQFQSDTEALYACQHAAGTTGGLVAQANGACAHYSSQSDIDGCSYGVVYDTCSSQPNVTSTQAAACMSGYANRTQSTYCNDTYTADSQAACAVGASLDPTSK